MKLHRFFVNKAIPASGEFVVSDENLLNQWRNVLRFGAGDRVGLFDGGGDEFLCEFASLAKKEAVFTVLEQKKGQKPAREIVLCMALIKKDNFELVLEKATELGVSSIVPVECARSEKKGINRERCEKILREASEQSGRATVPTLEDPEPLETIALLRPGLRKGELVVFDPRGEQSARAFFAAGQATPTSILIGPEGGFTDEELAHFREQNIPIVTTGPQILRAETAAIVALTLALVV